MHAEFSLLCMATSYSVWPNMCSVAISDTQFHVPFLVFRIALRYFPTLGLTVYQVASIVCMANLWGGASAGFMWTCVHSQRHYLPLGLEM